jgi:hypothetical protein
LKLDRLCSVVDGTAGFDPKRTPDKAGGPRSRTQRWLFFRD